jgi:hypothetical protein
MTTNTDNLSGVIHEKQDLGLDVLAASSAPIILVLGTAAQGPSETPRVVGRAQESTVLFGSSGTLIRGMYETKTAGGESVVLFRFGATPAVLAGIGISGTTDGIIITTVGKDDSMDTSYSFYWDDTGQQLVIKDVAADVVVFDRTFTNPLPTTDLGAVMVDGAPDTGGIDIGDSDTFLTLRAAADSSSPVYDVGLTDGTDGTSLSRMEIYEYLFESYKLLENEDFDLVVPMDVYLDDANIKDAGTYNTAPGAVYPTAASSEDLLLYFYAEEYQGEWLFWWRKTSASGNPDIYPEVAYATESPAGVDLTTTLFHEVNFAYQLANFCYDVSRNHNECHGFVNIKPPITTSLRDVSNWLGKAPTYVTSSAGVQTIASALFDGTGILGNKFMAGKFGFRTSLAYGGFISTEDGYLDGVEETDRGGALIDIGKYISVCGQWFNLFNGFDTTGLGYTTGLASTYAGMVSKLDPKSAPTNKVVSGARLPFRISNSKLNTLVGQRYIFCQVKPKGTVIADAPTAARPESDYRRLTTNRIVKLTIDAIRAVADPFIGEAGGAAQRAALETACQGALNKLQKAGYLSRFELVITQTAAERSLGLATIELVLVPAFELRRITLVISLKST